MIKPGLVVYSQEFPYCPYFQDTFDTVFKVEPAYTQKQFLSQIRNHHPDAAVVCFCSACKENVEELLQLDATTGPLPFLSCSKKLTLDFVTTAANSGVNRFLCCQWSKKKIIPIVLEAIRLGGMKEFLAVYYPNSLSPSRYVGKIVNEIIHTFPRRLPESHVAEKLGISPRWLRTICRQAFGRTFTQLMRQIRVLQALRLMKHTTLDNLDVALQLNYSEESNMARDFRKELGYNPCEARKRLCECTPNELLRSA